jgi:fucose permease
MAVFFTAGMIYASWGVNVPTVRDKFGLNAAQLSVVLFMVAGGAIAAMTRIGPWLARVGNRTAYLVAGLGMAASAALILAMPTYWSLLGMLALFGITSATMDVAMNAEASLVETHIGRPVMSALHGMWSIGGMCGAAAGGALRSAGLAPPLHMGLVALLGAAVLLAARPAVLPPSGTAADTARGPQRAGSRGLMLLGIVALIALIAEGAMYDWSTIYMRDVVQATPAFASAAFASFSGGMALGRFAGDFVRAHLGAASLICASATLACVGMLVALLLPLAPVALGGFAAMGLGLANMMPVLFAAAARVDGIHAAEGLARVAALAYIGLLIGPVMIGGVAQLTNLTTGLSVVALCSAAVAVIGPRVLRELQL